uniref:Uncharacterized protein n=1 Tax=Vespula pensylvanica TaxID=30213 RepID=A0A834PAA0_VESPE|nr:hypothetical protein H0235_002592 [Vespula pensylvanica]
MSGYFSNAILTDIAYLPGSTGIVSKIFTPRGSIWRWKARESATNAREHAPLSFGEFAVRRTTKKPCLKYAEEELPCISKPNLTKNVTRRRRSKMVKEMSKGGVSIRTKLFRDSPQDISHFRAALKA